MIPRNTLMILVSTLALMSALAGCMSSVDDDPLDDIDACATCPLGAADAVFSVEEGSYEALAILAVASTASFEVLDFEVPLSRTAAMNIIDRRGDGYTTLEQLDAVPYVGPAAFRALAAYVRDAGLIGACGDGIVQAPIETCERSTPLCSDTCVAAHGDSIYDDERIADYALVHGVRERSYLAGGILRVANELSEYRLDEEVPLDARAAYQIVANRGRGYPSLVRLDDVAYVGPAAFSALAEFAIGGGYLPACGDAQVYGPLETCDDGNVVDGDGCSARCELESFCGDGLVESPFEECDDGNASNGDGCNYRCGYETLQHAPVSSLTEVGAYRRLRGLRDPNGRYTQDWALSVESSATLVLTYAEDLRGQALCSSSEGSSYSGRFFLDGELLREGGGPVATFETYGPAPEALVITLTPGRYIIRVPAEDVCRPGTDGDYIGYAIELAIE